VKILGIETATAVCGVALVEDGFVIGEEWFEARQMHSEKLVTLVDHVLHMQNCTLGDVDAFAVSIGPGSFSGLRIGLSVAKGLAYARDLPLIAVPTLYALAQRSVMEELAGERGLVLPILDARRDEFYMALFARSGDALEEVVPSCAVRTVDLVAMIPDSTTSIVVMGDGAEKFQEYWKKTTRNDLPSMRFVFPPREKRMCSAASVTMTGERKFRRGEIADTSALEPLYVKEFSTTMKLQPTEVHR